MYQWWYKISSDDFNNKENSNGEASDEEDNAVK